MSTATVTIPTIEYKQMQKDLQRYEEMLDFYEAKRDSENVKDTGKLKELSSLADLME